MIFSKQLQFGEHARTQRARLLRELREKHFMLGTYLITGANAPNLYEIHHASVLLNPTLDTENLEILGIGFGYQDTVKLVQRMLEERFCP